MSFGVSGFNESAGLFMNETEAANTTKMFFMGVNVFIGFRQRHNLTLLNIFDPENNGKLPINFEWPGYPLSEPIDPQPWQPPPVFNNLRIEDKTVLLRVAHCDGVSRSYANNRSDIFSGIETYFADPLRSNGAPASRFEGLERAMLASFYGIDTSGPLVANLPFLFRIPFNGHPYSTSFEYDPDISVLFAGNWNDYVTPSSAPSALVLAAADSTAIIVGIVVAIVIAVAILAGISVLALNPKLRAKVMPLSVSPTKANTLADDSHVKPLATDPSPRSSRAWSSARNPSSPSLRNQAE